MALPGCGEALGLASLRATHPGFWLILVPSVARAESLEAELRFFLGTQTGLAVFPDTEVLPYDTFSPYQDLTSRRLMVLRDVAAGRISTLVVAASTLLPRLAPTRYIGGYSISLAAGQKLRPEQLRLQLETAGYQRVAQVMEHGDFAVRGSLLDFYPMGSEQPVRIDFLDDEIESLREFDPDSQLSGALLSKHWKPCRRGKCRSMPKPSSSSARPTGAVSRATRPARSSIAKYPKDACLAASKTICRCSSTRPPCSGIICRPDA